jgi:hypothetical protein
MNSRWSALWALLLAVVLAATPRASLAGDQGPISGEFGFLIGANWADADYFPPGNGSSMSPLFGIRMASRFEPRWNWFADGVYSQPTYDASGDIKMFELRTGLERLMPMGSGNTNFFVAGAIGAGQANYPPSASNFGRPLLSLGIGLAGANGGFRTELRGENWFGNNGVSGDNLINGQFIVGYSFGFRAGGLADSDADGVNDDKQMRDCFHENSIVRIRARLPQKVSLGRSENYVRRCKEADPLSVQSHRRPPAP